MKYDEKAAHAFWRSPDPSNHYLQYLNAAPPGRTLWFVSLVRRWCPPPATLLEPGCNAGRNLAGFQVAGYTTLGVEINADAARAAPGDVRVGALKDVLPTLDPVDVVVTMAVLEHITPEEAQIVFPELARLAKRFLIVVEDERGESPRHFPRNYLHVFSAQGLRHRHSGRPPAAAALGAGFFVRVFEGTP